MKVPRGASLKWLQVAIDFQLEGGSLHLFQNNYTPVDTTVVGDLTEATFDGYAANALAGWSAAALDVNNKAATEAPLSTFTKTAGATTNTIYGVYCLDVDGDLAYAERNPAGGVLINTTGQTYSNLPRVTLKTEV
jgi:hypothetical protein